MAITGHHWSKVESLLRFLWDLERAVPNQLRSEILDHIGRIHLQTILKKV